MHYMFTMNPKTFIYRKGVNLIISWQCQNKYNEKDTACDDEECPIYDNRIIHTFLEHSVVSWLRTGIAEKQSVPPSSRGYDNYSEGISIHFNKILKITSLLSPNYFTFLHKRVPTLDMTKYTNSLTREKKPLKLLIIA